MNTAGPATLFDNQPHDWSDLVERIKRCDGSGIEELYNMLHRGIRYYMNRKLGSSNDEEDRVHDALLCIIEAIQSSKLKDADKLIPYSHAIVRHKMCADIKDIVVKRRREGNLPWVMIDGIDGPEMQYYKKQQSGVMMKALHSLSESDQSILTRSCIDEQTEADIRKEMNLSPTQYRLLRNRAKDRLMIKAKRMLKGNILESRVPR